MCRRNGQVRLRGGPEPRGMGYLAEIRAFALRANLLAGPKFATRGGEAPPYPLERYRFSLRIRSFPWMCFFGEFLDARAPNLPMQGAGIGDLPTPRLRPSEPRLIGVAHWRGRGGFSAYSGTLQSSSCIPTRIRCLPFATVREHLLWTRPSRASGRSRASVKLCLLVNR